MTPEATTWCRLAFLSLRFTDRPVDLSPAFDANTFTYTATLEFGMDSFYIDAIAKPGCVTDKAPIAVIPVPIGSSKQLTIFAKDPKTDTRQAYEIQVKRMQGSETLLRSLRVGGASLSPEFNPNVDRYTATLALGYDIATLAYTLADNGQMVHCAATAQQPLADIPSDGSSSSRRLLATGEVQFRENHQSFPIDVGFKRQLTITIQSTDPQVRARGSYVISVVRQGCTPTRPLYDPVSKACVVHCPSGYYPNVESSRCSKCNSNCAVCLNIMECQLCQEATLDFSYSMQPDGSCLQASNGLLDRYMWWVVGSGVFVGLLLCVGLCLLCQCLCATCCGKSRHRYDSDSDMDT
jgi:hypothetical protein